MSDCIADLQVKLESISQLVKNLIEECNDMRNHKNKFVESVNLSIEDYNIGGTPDVYFVIEQQKCLQEFNDNTKYIDNNIDKITDRLENEIFHNGPSALSIKSKKLRNNYPISYCLYDGYCANCENGTSDLEKIVDFCIKCKICIAFRDLENKRVKEDAKEIYNTKINPKNAIIKKQPIEPITQTINQTVNNVYIQCDSLTVNIQQPYFESNDKIFYVTVEIVRPTIDEMITNLKYIFTSLMCGVKGKYIFPDEEKYSTSTSYPVSAALYTIKNEDTKPVLHGLLKYQKNDSSSVMTIKKLQNINKSNNISKRPIVKVLAMPLWEDKKSFYCVKSLEDTVKTISNTKYYGSNVEDFTSNK